MEEYGYVLDYLPSGKASDRKSEPIVQMVGDKYFTLLEFVPKQEQKFTAGEKVFVGEDPEKRDKLDFIKGRIKYDDLTRNAQIELDPILERIVKEQEKRFVEFYNSACSITTKLHQIELLPGVGKKHMWALLEARETTKFESFDELVEKIHLLPDPKKSIVRKIIAEMKGTEKYVLFTLPFKKKRSY